MKLIPLSFLPRLTRCLLLLHLLEIVEDSEEDVEIVVDLVEDPVEVPEKTRRRSGKL